MLDSTIFRRYDIRGIAGTQLTEEVAFDVGRALGTRIIRRGGRDAALGRDVRLTSPALASAAGRGLAATGLKVADLGIVSSPILYHALHRRCLGGGIMVTGSHNPVSDNGLKLCLGTEPVFGDAVASLPTQIAMADFEVGSGSVRVTAYLSDYLGEIARLFPLPPGLRVAVDAGNGVMGPIALEAFARIGIEVEALYCEPDGRFPNHLPDPEVEQYMKALGHCVVSQSVACGLGFDGDGDRVGVLDERGRKLSADWLLAIFARDLLKRHPGGKVRYDVKCSDFLERDIHAHGGVPVLGETGHALLKRDVVELDAILGGELSGHFVFNRGYLPIDDALYSALTFLRILQQYGEGAASSLFAGFPSLKSTAEIKLPCADGVKFDVIRALVARFTKAGLDVNALDGARVRIEDAWFLVRASNTTQNLTVRLEAASEDAFAHARALLLAELVQIQDVDTAPLEEV